MNPMSTPSSSRPGFHFTPAKNWMNDPNGLVFLEGEYHLFYQHNAFADTPGSIGWGHAISRDLIHWEHLPVAIPFTDAGEESIMAFSGCAVVDHHNSSGFGLNGKPLLVLIFTGHIDAKQIQDQRLAFSNDRGRTWTIFEGNPVLDIGQNDFRDPKVFWHEASRRWVMLLALANDCKLQFYGSSNLRDWTHLSDWGPFSSHEWNWEVPELFELPVLDSNRADSNRADSNRADSNGDGSSDLIGETRWVLKVDVGTGGPFGGSAGMYFLGQFDGERFIADDPNLSLSTPANWLDFGKDFYAPITFANLPDDRLIWLGWMNNWQYAAQTPTSPWRGAMSIPRTIGLKRFSSGLELVQQPVRELEKLRGKHHRFTDLQLEAGSKILEIRGERLEIIAEFKLETASEFGLKVRVGPNNESIVGYNSSSQELFVDRRKSGQIDFSEHFTGRHSGPLPPEDGLLHLHIFVDSCSLEVFGNQGRTVITDLIFPESNATGLELFVTDGGVQLFSLNVWELA
jgi:fructan beta-fructosidase